ncbi:hypothetical protein T484DRAFT_1851023 [Baffinella frigidus]|nr:hypothetical protein T484DRAFT_1851023 [Cryptophyta sp. CCMP2293]
MPQRKTGPFRPGMNSRTSSVARSSSSSQPRSFEEIPSAFDEQRPATSAGERGRGPRGRAAEHMELPDVELDPVWAAASGGAHSMYRMQPRAPQRAREQEWLEERGGHAAHDEEGGGAAQQRPHTSLDLNILRDQGRSQFEDLLPFSSGRRTGYGSVATKGRNPIAGIRTAEAIDRESAAVFGDDARTAVGRSVDGVGKFIAARGLELKLAEVIKEGDRILQVPPLTVANKKLHAYLIPELFHILDATVANKKLHAFLIPELFHILDAMAHNL